MELINQMCNYHCFDNVNIEWDKGSRAFKQYMMELIITCVVTTVLIM